MYHILLIYTMDRCLVGFHLLAVAHNAAVNTGEKVFVQDSVFNFCVDRPRCGIVGPYGCAFLLSDACMYYFGQVAKPFGASLDRTFSGSTLNISYYLQNDDK